METQTTNEHIITVTLISESERQIWRQEKIDEIKAILDELRELKIYGSSPNYDTLPDLDLLEQVEVHRDWLGRRKTFKAWLDRLEEIKRGEMKEVKNTKIYPNTSVNGVKITEIYTDGGVILKNPSPIGGTWAFVAVDSEGNQVHEESGVVPATSTRTVSNNHSEKIAIVKALEWLPDGWSGKVLSDSQIALGRVFKNWQERNLPRNVSMRTKAAVARLGKIETVLLQGHPTNADLACGIGKKRGFPVSIHNVRCDKLCGIEAKKYLENLDIQPEKTDEIEIGSNSIIDEIEAHHLGNLTEE